MKEYFKDKKGFLWILIYELLCTLSNEPSFFASKRLERLVMFWVCIWVVIGFVIRKWNDLTYDQMLCIAGFLIGYSAWNAVQIRKDQKELPGQPNQSTESK